MAKGRVTFDEERCKGCGLCVIACPMKIVSLDTDRINNKGYNPSRIIEMDKCIGCGNCGIMCPDYVITVEKAN